MTHTPARVRVRAPATSANLGPGFDCLGLALDLWNEAEFSLEGDGVRVEVEGLGKGILPTGADNLVARMALQAYAAVGQAPPVGLHIRCRNRIPPGAGLGSSAAAVLLGVLGANALMGHPLEIGAVLELAAQAEGHPDNAGAALSGGLTLSVHLAEGYLIRRIEIPPLRVALTVPRFQLPTREARRALPAQVPMADAVFNLARTALVVEALRSGDLDLLGKVLEDRLHQPYRLPVIPGARAAIQAARATGAAVALSGAGPSLIAFCAGDPAVPAEAMAAAFRAAGLEAEAMVLAVSPTGAGTVQG